MNNMMFNFNQMAMNNPMMGMNIQQNQMNGMMMDETAQNIRNIIQPYENKIRELEEIIKQKDFEIIVLKQKLNNNNSIINNMNPMMINMNMNPMNIMMGNMNQQMENRGEVISLSIISEKKGESIECFINDKASILYEKCNLTKKALTFNYKPIDPDLTIKENGIILNNSLIYVNKKIINILFKDNQRKSFAICLSEDCPIEIALIYYFMMIGRIMDRENPKFAFLYNAEQLKANDKTPIMQFFQNNYNPQVTVIKYN